MFTLCDNLTIFLKLRHCKVWPWPQFHSFATIVVFYNDHYRQLYDIRAMQGISVQNVKYKFIIKAGLSYIRKHSRWLACCHISTIWVSSKKNQKSNIGWPQQPPTEKIPNVSKNWIFHDPFHKKGPVLAFWCQGLKWWICGNMLTTLNVF